MKIFKFKNWFSIAVENPLEEWKLARKFFKFPKLSLCCYKHIPDEEEKRVAISFRCWSMSWKSKYGMLEYEHNPYACLKLFNRWCIQLDFLAPGNDITCEPICYWEGILTYMKYRYHNKDFGYAVKEESEAECLYHAYQENIWGRQASTSYTIKPYLTNIGWHTLHSVMQAHSVDSAASTLT